MTERAVEELTVLHTPTLRVGDLSVRVRVGGDRDPARYAPAPLECVARPQTVSVGQQARERQLRVAFDGDHRSRTSRRTAAAASITLATSSSRRPWQLSSRAEVAASPASACTLATPPSNCSRLQRSRSRSSQKLTDLAPRPRPAGVRSTLRSSPRRARARQLHGEARIAAHPCPRASRDAEMLPAAPQGHRVLHP